MMKQLYILTLFLLTSVSAQAQTTNDKISIDHLSAEEKDGFVTVSFTAAITSRAAWRNEIYAFMPVLTDGNFRVSFPPVLVKGKNYRSEWKEGIENEMVLASNGETINYSAVVEAQEWMHGALLYLESSTDVCSTVYSYPALLLAENLCLYDEPAPQEIITEVRRFAPRTIADSLSMTFPFVLPEWMFDPADPFRIYDEERETSLIVYYHQGKYDIEESYRNNKQTLFNLTAAAEMILHDPESKVERVVVAGFASPEGSFELNDVLAFNRAVAVKHHLLQSSGLSDDQILIYNGSVDWRGLRLLVSQSTMPHKHSILSIIDHTPVWDSERQIGRLGELQRLDGGAPYRYMLENLFPLLRNGAFIKIYYSNE